ncbi:MAG: hypothetical protein ABIA63_07125 [bacterium]
MKKMYYTTQIAGFLAALVFFYAKMPSVASFAVGAAVEANIFLMIMPWIKKNNPTLIPFCIVAFGIHLQALFLVILS